MDNNSKDESVNEDLHKLLNDFQRAGAAKLSYEEILNILFKKYTDKSLTIIMNKAGYFNVIYKQNQIIKSSCVDNNLLQALNKLVDSIEIL